MQYRIDVNAFRQHPHAFQKHRFPLTGPEVSEQMWRHFGNAGGAYILYCMDAAGTNRLVIPWRDHIITGGILYTGAACYLRKRTTELHSSISNAEDLGFWDLRRHPCGQYYLDLEVQRQFPRAQLWVTTIWYPGNGLTLDLACWIENVGLHVYRDQDAHRQLPYMNKKSPGSLYLPGIPIEEQQPWVEQLWALFTDEWGEPDELAPR